MIAYSSSEAAALLTGKTRRRSSAPAALTLANVISNDDRVQSANSVSHYLIISGDLLASSASLLIRLEQGNTAKHTADMMFPQSRHSVSLVELVPVGK